MQSSIPNGAVLQNRYRVLSVLGQGGFGRTYLAEDLGRFNERCALKEFIPPSGSTYALDKSKELFQREASILYQIKHPQVPQFRATFEEDQRLFLVQDYVEGKTCRTQLNEIKVQGKTFSEPDVFRLVQQLLPVLTYIHSKDIIHRDIAPDNIILRQPDGLPVLIDFGVVKEIATRVQSAETGAQSTTVGKMGYAPPEQMQTGRAYPSSDLYALAVTAVVLLTGKEPQELYDDHSLTWHWQRWARVNPGFAQVLNRMLSYRPGDRYSSAQEVALALQELSDPTAVSPTVAPRPASASPPPNPNISQMQTMAIGRRPEPIPTQPVPVRSNPSNPPRRQPAPVIPPNESSVWDNPFAVFAIGTGMAVITGIAAWAIVSAILNTSEPNPSASPSPSATVAETPTKPSPSPSPSPSASSQPVEYSQRLPLNLNETKTAEGNLKANETVVYIISMQQGQTLSASLEGEGVLLSVLSPDRKPADDRSERVQSWQGTLNYTGDYAIRLSPVKGVSDSDYKLKLTLEPAAAEPSPPSPSPSSSPSPSPPQVETQPLDVPPGRKIQVSDRASDAVVKRYLINAQPEQVIKVELVDGAVTLTIRYPDGRPVEDATGVVSWESQVTEPGAYQVDVNATQPTNFSLNVGVSQQPAQQKQ